MNSIITKRFDLVEEWLLASSVVVSYEIIRRDISLLDGKFRIKVTFSDDSSAELFEYATISKASIHILKYSSHWQDKNGNLINRWDNAPHHPDLLGAPHHRHNSDQSVSGISVFLEMLEVLKMMENIIYRRYTTV